MKKYLLLAWEKGKTIKAYYETKEMALKVQHDLKNKYNICSQIQEIL